VDKDKVDVLLQLKKQTVSSVQEEALTFLTIITLWYYFENYAFAILLLVTYIIGNYAVGSECNKYTKMIKTELDKEE